MTQRDHGADLAGRQSGVLAEPFNVAGPAGPWGVLLSLAASHVAKLLSPAPPHWPRSHHDAATSALLSIKLDCHPHLPSRLARHGIVLFRTLLRHDVLPFHACICFLCWKLPGTNSEKSQISVRLRIRGHPSPGTGMGGGARVAPLYLVPFLAPRRRAWSLVGGGGANPGPLPLREWLGQWRCAPYSTASIVTRSCFGAIASREGLVDMVLRIPLVVGCDSFPFHHRLSPIARPYLSGIA